MNLRKKMYLYNYNSVAHTTLNEHGNPIRVNLIHPHFHIFKEMPSMLIINGQEILAINTSWAILLNNFIEEVNFYRGVEITEKLAQEITWRTCEETKKVFPKTSEAQLRDDLRLILTVIRDVAYGKSLPEKVGHMPVSRFETCIKAPLRMDIVLSDTTFSNNLSINQWKEVLGKLRRIGVIEVVFRGTCSSYLEVVRTAKLKHFITRIEEPDDFLSNEVLRRFKYLGLDCIQYKFTLDYEKAGAIFEIKNALREGLNVSANIEISKDFEENKELLTLLQKLGVKNVTLSVPCSSNLTKEELVKAIQYVHSFCELHQMECSLTSPGWVSSTELSKLGMRTPYCGACLSNMAILPNGDVLPCRNWRQDEVLGNILTDEWEDIWNNPTCTSMRNLTSMMSTICPLRNKNKYTS